MQTILVFLVSVFISFGCKKNDGPVSSAKFAPIDPAADNYALLFGAPNDLPGVVTDIVEMENLLNNSGYGYRVISNPSTSKSELLSTLRNYGAKISDRGTLLLYFSGHGTPSGLFVTEESAKITKKDLDNFANAGPFKGQFASPTEIMGALRDARSKSGKTQPIRFLISIVDTCFSGAWLKGDNKLSTLNLAADTGFGNDSGQPTTTRSLRALLDNATIEQNNAIQSAQTMSFKVSGNPFLANFITVAAASENEAAVDEGYIKGGRFSSSLRRVFEEAKQSRTPMTFRQWLDRTYMKVLPDHHVAYQASSKAVLSIDLFAPNKALINEDMTPTEHTSFEFLVSSFLDGQRAKFRVTGVKNCPSEQISWTIDLVAGGACSLAGGPCSFKTRPSEFTFEFPEPRQDFYLKGICGKGQPVIHKVMLASAAMDDDGDGVANALDKCTPTQKGLAVEKSGARAGCAAQELTNIEDTDRDGIKTIEDLCKFTPSGKSVEKTGARKGCAAGEVLTPKPDPLPKDDGDILAP